MNDHKNKRSRVLAALCSVICVMSAMPAMSASAAAAKYEAEDAVISGQRITVENGSGYSGGKYVALATNNINSSLTFKVNADESGIYDVVVRASGIGADKTNRLKVDGVVAANIISEKDKLGDSKTVQTYLSKGSHDITITPTDGYINVDYITVEKGVAKDYAKGVSKELINENASDSAKRLMSFIVDNYGVNTIAGQQCDGTGGSGYGLNGGEIKAIEEQTGRKPALLGLDLMNLNNVLDGATEFSEAGGIVSLCWHWRAPTKYVKEGNDSNGNPYSWSAFNTSSLKDFDFDAIMNGEDEDGYNKLMFTVDNIAKKLQQLDEADIPILFRPLHEASGGWFWWGSGSPESYKKLWITLYDKFTNEYGINNLIWVWNGQDKDWYPGDEYVDIIGEDIYPGKHVYRAQSVRFDDAANYTETPKVVTLSENGCLFDPFQAGVLNTVWSWFCVWNGDFTFNKSGISQTYTEKYMWNYVYNHQNVITLDEMPDLKTYPLTGGTPVKSKETDYSAELALGDINADGKVDSKDALLSISFAKKATTPKNDQQLLAADIDGSGDIKTNDALKIIAYAKKTIKKLP